MIVVTGGAGFIGSNLVAALNRRGIKTIAICDRLRDGLKWRNIAKRQIHDIIPPEALFTWLDTNAASVERVFHMGAISATTAVDGDLVIAQNFTYSVRLWDFCTRHRIPFIYASSAATYGDGSQDFDDDPDIAALEKLRPLNLYGWSKHLFDQRVLRTIKADGPCPPQWAGLKFFNVFGPNEGHKGAMQSVVAKIFPEVTNGQPARLFKSAHPDFKDGGQLRDFIWVDDVVQIMLWLSDHSDICGLFNAGTGQARSFADLAHAVFSALNQPARIEYVTMPHELQAKYQYFTQANMRRLKAAGFNEPFTPLETAVGSYVQDFLAQPDPFR